MKITLLTFGLLFAIISNVQAATVTKTTITKTSVTPTSAPAGTMFKFTAELNAPLTTGNKVKIDLGKGLASMTGTKTSYSLSRAIYTTGSQTYKVGIYNAKNVLQGIVKNGTYSVTSATQLNHAPRLTSANPNSVATINENYTVTFNAHDTDGNLNSITVDWGDSSAPEMLTATDRQDLVFNHIYATAGAFLWSATATDSGTPALSSEKVTQAITVVAAGNYTKVCNSGALAGEEDCPVNPVLGNKPTDWACTKDNDTGLIWEVKTTDGGLRDMNKDYANYTADYPTCTEFCHIVSTCTGLNICETVNMSKSFGDSANADSFVLNVNSQGLCGASDWRLPTQDELLGIVKLGNNPTIDTTYFPDITENYWFWSSSPSASYNSYARLVSFDNGDSRYYSKDSSNSVRLVRG